MRLNPSFDADHRLTCVVGPSGAPDDFGSGDFERAHGLRARVRGGVRAGRANHRFHARLHLASVAALHRNVQSVRFVGPMDVARSTYRWIPRFTRIPALEAA